MAMGVKMLNCRQKYWLPIAPLVRRQDAQGEFAMPGSLTKRCRSSTQVSWCCWTTSIPRREVVRNNKDKHNCAFDQVYLPAATDCTVANYGRVIHCRFVLWELPGNPGAGFETTVAEQDKSDGASQQWTICDWRKEEKNRQVEYRYSKKGYGSVILWLDDRKIYQDDQEEEVATKATGLNDSAAQSLYADLTVHLTFSQSVTWYTLIMHLTTQRYWIQKVIWLWRCILDYICACACCYVYLGK